MMGYKESIAQELSLGDPLFQRIHNLRPLIPNSYLSPPNHNHLLHHHHDFGNNNNNNKNKGVIIEECNKEGMNAQAQHQVMVSSRWNPTPEQLTALEELYRCGTRTPSAEQIQHITAQLRRYGKIEGKNVFYWFQNHKARERQKRRRQLQPHLTSTTNTTTHANHVLDKGFEEEEKNGKRALFITNNNKESDSEAPILQQPAAAAAVTAAGPRKSDNSSNSLQCLFQFHQQSSAQQFQPNYNPNNSSSSSSYPTNNNKHLFLSDQLGNATCSPPHLHLFSLSSEGGCRGDGVVVPTLQLFPVAKPGGGGDGEDCELKKDGEVGLCLSSSKEEKNDSNEFVPYYHFL